jgi:hypothetical protein
MATRILLILLQISAMLAPCFLTAQEVWNGNFIEFEKDSLADWTLEENQDRITDNVWLTRKNIRGIFNIAQENGFSHVNGSPLDTEWAFGTTAQYEDLVYEPWSSAIDSMVNLMIGEDMVIHLISDDIYIDIKVLEWGITQAGGGYMRYQRATENVPLATDEIEAENLTLFPNPAKDFISIKGVSSPIIVAVYSSAGEMVKKITYHPGVPLDLSSFSPGLYYLKIGSRSIRKLLIF